MPLLILLILVTQMRGSGNQWKARTRSCCRMETTLWEYDDELFVLGEYTSRELICFSTRRTSNISNIILSYQYLIFPVSLMVI